MRHLDNIIKEKTLELETPNPLAVLPLEVLFKIIFYLDTNDLNKLSQVNKALLDTITSDIFWEKLLNLDFPEQYEIYITLKQSNTQFRSAKQEYIFAWKKLTSSHTSKTNKLAAEASLLINRGDISGLKKVLNQVNANMEYDFLTFPYPFRNIRSQPHTDMRHWDLNVDANLFNLAILRGNSEIISLLINSFTKLEFFASILVAAVKQAILIDRLDIIDLLLEENPSIINCYEKGYSPFLFSHENKHFEMATALVKRGAILKPFEISGYLNALAQLALKKPEEREHYQQLIITAIQEYFPHVNDLDQDSLIVLIKNNFLKVMNWLLEQEFNLKKYARLVFTAVTNNNAAMVLLFLSQGADLNILVGYALTNLIEQFPHLNHIWETHGNITGPEDQRSFETRRLEKITAALNDWITATEQDKEVIFLQEKISHWQELQNVSSTRPHTDELMKDLEEMIKQEETADKKLVWRLRFIKGKLELQKNNIEEPAMLPEAEDEHVPTSNALKR